MNVNRPESNALRPFAALFSVSLMMAACVARPASTEITPTNVSLPPASGGDSVQVAVDERTYHPGETVALRLVNRTSLTLGYNACTRTLQRNAAGVWLTLPDSGRMCTMELRLLAPGAAQTATTLLQSQLTPGMYRLVLNLSPQLESARSGATQSINAASNGFRVE